MTNYDILKEYEAHKTPIPSYNEWRELHKRLKDTQNLELEVRRENQQLKMLLNQCKYELSGCYTDVGWEDWSLITKIDNAVGEK